MTLLPTPTICIRQLEGQPDLEAAVSLQREVWGYGDLDLDSRGILTVASRFAGQTLGAFHNERLVGFTLAFATLAGGRMHSHRVGVHPDYQNLSIGRRLKLAQREDALARGIPIIQWTFDPLQPRNAYFNLVRLGGVARTYLPNLYGITTSPLHGGLPTDRLLIEWELESERVQRILAGDRGLMKPGPVNSDAHAVDLQPEPARRTPEAQQVLREQLMRFFAQGYAVTGFRENSNSHSYLLEKEPGQAG